MERVKEYALKKYPKRFKNIDPIVEDGGSHWRVYHHIDSSPLILSKNI